MYIIRKNVEVDLQQIMSQDNMGKHKFLFVTETVLKFLL